MQDSLTKNNSLKILFINVFAFTLLNYTNLLNFYFYKFFSIIIANILNIIVNEY